MLKKMTVRRNTLQSNKTLGEVQPVDRRKAEGEEQRSSITTKGWLFFGWKIQHFCWEQAICSRI
jgi:hypothetical protein